MSAESASFKSVGDVRFEQRTQVVMLLTEDWPSSDDSQAREPTRDREIVLANKIEPVHGSRVPEAVGRVQEGAGLWRNPSNG